MLFQSDFLRLPYTADLTEAGIAYALRLLAREKILYHRMTRMVAGVAAELALRRHLSQQQIPFDVEQSLPLAERDRYDVHLAGRRCDVKSFFISYRGQISKMRRDPSMLLNVPALVPSDVDAGEGHSDSDVYIFSFVTGLKTLARQDVEKVIAANQPHYFIHRMPEWWRKPPRWNPLGGLILKSESNLRVEVELGGQDKSRGYITRQIILPPGQRVRVEDCFYSLSSIHIKNFPAARIGILAQGQPYIIAPEEWKNIWVYGMEILFAGYITRGEFRQRARHIPPKTPVFQYNWTRVKNLAVPVSTLKPLQKLFDDARGG